MTSLRSTILAAIPALLLACNVGESDDTTGSILSCHETDEGLVCDEPDGDDEDGDDHPDAPPAVCEDSGCVTECADTDYGTRCVTECEGGLRCVEECAVHEGEQVCEHACTCPEGEGEGDGEGGGDDQPPPDGEGGGDDQPPPDGDGGGEETPPPDGDGGGDDQPPPDGDGGGDGGGEEPPPDGDGA